MHSRLSHLLPYTYVHICAREAKMNKYVWVRTVSMHCKYIDYNIVQYVPLHVNMHCTYIRTVYCHLLII